MMRRPAAMFPYVSVPTSYEDPGPCVEVEPDRYYGHFFIGFGFNPPLETYPLEGTVDRLDGAFSIADSWGYRGPRISLP